MSVPLADLHRVLRSGSWGVRARDSRVACRNADAPWSWDAYLGFRLMRRTS